jgi:hypothetical protein
VIALQENLIASTHAQQLMTQPVDPSSIVSRPDKQQHSQKQRNQQANTFPAKTAKTKKR